MHCGDAEALAIIDKQVTEFCLTEAARIGQNSLKNGLKVAWRTGDRAEYLGGSGLSLQCLGKVLPSLGKFVPLFFELLLQIGTRLTHPTNALSRHRYSIIRVSCVLAAIRSLSHRHRPISRVVPALSADVTPLELNP